MSRSGGTDRSKALMMRIFKRGGSDATLFPKRGGFGGSESTLLSGGRFSADPLEGVDWGAMDMEDIPPVNFMR